MITGICLSGKKYAGKDELFGHWDKVLERQVAIHKWASSLRNDCVRMMAAVGVNITYDDLMDREKKEPFVGLLQWYGTDYRRRQDMDYWVKQGMQDILDLQHFQKDLFGQVDLFVNTDTRFPNEVLIPKQHGFISIRLEVSPANQQLRAAKLGEELTKAKRLHFSELALDDFTEFDATIDANRPLEEVWRDADAVLESYGVMCRKCTEEE